MRPVVLCMRGRRTQSCPPVMIKAPALRSRLGMMKWRAVWNRSHSRQRQFAPWPAGGRAAERRAAAIQCREIDHNRQAEPGARLGFIQPLAAPRDLDALVTRQPPPVVVDDDS